MRSANQLDVQVTALADAHELVYSRYAEDLVFSAAVPDKLRNIPKELENIFSTLEFPKSLTIKGEQTWHGSRRGRRKVTGLVLTSDGKLSVGRRLKRRLRTEVHKWYTLETNARLHLAGLLTFVRSVEPEFINSLMVKYGADRVLSAMRLA